MMEDETGEKRVCAVCKQVIIEGYVLHPDMQEEWDALTKRFGDTSNWYVGECCFGGYCQHPDDWLDYLESKENSSD